MPKGSSKPRATERRGRRNLSPQPRLLAPGIERYLDRLQLPADPILREMEQLGARTGFPLIGPLVGKLLAQIVWMTGARQAFELGSGFGYSAAWIARALPEDGLVYLTERDPEQVGRADDFLRRAGLRHKTTLLQGDALELFHEHAPEALDLVLCDIDKESYPQAYRLVLPRLRVGGVLITDNVLWSGKVARSRVRDPATAAIREFNRLAHADPDGLTTIVPLRDGVAITLKLR
jgi:predicted O-methyltransferase YrrM